MATLKDIDDKAKWYSIARGDLAMAIAHLDDEIAQLKRRLLPGIKNRVAKAKQAEAELRAAIEESPQLFQEPRTLVMHGLRVGYRKAPGTIEIDDNERVAELIRKHFPDLFEVLVKTEHKPIKKALSALSVADLRRVGVTVEETGDVVTIKDVAGDVDKLVAAFLKEHEEEIAA